MARPIAREAAMQLVFEQLFGGEATAETLVDLIDYNPGEKDSTYIDTVVSVPRGFGDYAPCRVRNAVQRPAGGGGDQRGG